MMKNRKIIMVFVLIIAFLLVMITCTQATGDGGLVVKPVNNEQSNNNENNATNNEQNNTNTNSNTNNGTNTNTNGTNEPNLPQTGVEENTILLFAFITIAIASAVYAYIKIRKYNKI